MDKNFDTSEWLDEARKIIKEQISSVNAQLQLCTHDSQQAILREMVAWLESGFPAETVVEQIGNALRRNFASLVDTVETNDQVYVDFVYDGRMHARPYLDAAIIPMAEHLTKCKGTASLADLRIEEEFLEEHDGWHITFVWPFYNPEKV